MIYLSAASVVSAVSALMYFGTPSTENVDTIVEQTKPKVEVTDSKMVEDILPTPIEVKEQDHNSDLLVENTELPSKDNGKKHDVIVRKLDTVDEDFDTLKKVETKIDVKPSNIIYLDNIQLSKLGVLVKNNYVEFPVFQESSSPSCVTLDDKSGALIKGVPEDFEIKNYIYPCFVTNKKGEKILSFLGEDDGIRMIKHDQVLVSQFDNKNVNKVNNNKKINMKELQEKIEVILAEKLNSISKSERVSEMQKTILEKKLTELVADGDGNVNVESEIVLDSNPNFESGKHKLTDEKNAQDIEIKVYSDVVIKKVTLDNVDVVEDTNVTSIQTMTLFQNDKDLSEDGINIKEIIDFQKKYDERSRDINNFIPISVDINNDKEYDYIFWYDASKELAEFLPEYYKEKLTNELDMISITGHCDTDQIDVQEAMLDVWKGCNGSIKNMKVFPNPATVNSKLNLNLEESRSLEVSIYNMNGSIIKTLGTETNISAGDWEFDLDLSGLQPGMYFVVVQSSNAEQVMKRIIIQ